MPIQRAATLTGPLWRRPPPGVGQAGRHPRGRTLRQTYAFIRESAVTLGCTLVVALAALLATAQFVPSGLARGTIVSVGLVGVIGAMLKWILQVSRAAPHMLSDLGQRWTAHELRKLHLHGWVVMHNVRLQMRDIDHLLIGPGGVVAVETTWNTTAWTFDPIEQSVFDAARRAQAHTRDRRLWQDLEALGVDHVGSAVFVWGPGVHEVPSGAAIETTAVVTRRTACWWRRGLGADQLSPEQVTAVCRAVDVQCRTRDRREAPPSTLPAAPGQWLTRVVFAVVAACAGVLAVSSLMADGPQRTLSVAWWLLLLAVGMAAGRLGGLRHVGAAAGSVGVAAALLLAAAAMLALSAGSVPSAAV